ncbi:MAG TPA: hypothetical protein VG714_06745 [Acidobacteriaceae bacterium]|nr:hypothetical protein [Acidobacteriaceae bacterium]
MNRIAAIALFTIASFITLHRASAATITETRVPFAFTVNGITLPAGTYVVTSSSPNVMQISSTDHNHPNTVTVITREYAPGDPDGPAMLVFEAYGSQYFLHEIICPLRSTDAIVPASDQEKKVGKEWAGRNGGQPVLVAVR